MVLVASLAALDHAHWSYSPSHNHRTSQVAGLADHLALTLQVSPGVYTSVCACLCVQVGSPLY